MRGNTVSRSGYLPHTGHRVCVKRGERPRAAKLAVDDPLRDYVAAKLKKRCSPEQIRHRLQRDFPHDPGMRLSCETIYQGIYVHAHEELRRELAGSLRRGRSRRKPHRDRHTRTSRFIDEMAPIFQRPPTLKAARSQGARKGT